MLSIFFFLIFFFFFSSRRRHTRLTCDWSSDVCSSDLPRPATAEGRSAAAPRAPEPAPCRTWRRSAARAQDRKSTRLNSSHMSISYAVFCLKKKKKKKKKKKTKTKTNKI